MSPELQAAIERVKPTLAMDGSCPWEHPNYERTDGRSPMMKWQMDCYDIAKSVIEGHPELGFSVEDLLAGGRGFRVRHHRDCWDGSLAQRDYYKVEILDWQHWCGEFSSYELAFEAAMRTSEHHAKLEEDRRLLMVENAQLKKRLQELEESEEAK